MTPPNLLCSHLLRHEHSTSSLQILKKSTSASKIGLERTMPMPSYIYCGDDDDLGDRLCEAHCDTMGSQRG